MTKDELKQKLATDPDARQQFLAHTQKFYQNIGLDVSDEEMNTQKEALDRLATPSAASPRMAAGTNVNINIF